MAAIPMYLSRGSRRQRAPLLAVHASSFQQQLAGHRCAFSAIPGLARQCQLQAVELPTTLFPEDLPADAVASFNKMATRWQIQVLALHLTGNCLQQAVQSQQQAAMAGLAAHCQQLNCQALRVEVPEMLNCCQQTGQLPALLGLFATGLAAAGTGLLADCRELPEPLWQEIRAQLPATAGLRVLPPFSFKKPEACTTLAECLPNDLPMLSLPLACSAADNGFSVLEPFMALLAQNNFAGYLSFQCTADCQARAMQTLARARSLAMQAWAGKPA